MVRPKYRLGSSASIRPPVQAQSAGDQKMACEAGRVARSAGPTATTSARVGQAWGSKPNQFWLQTKPVRLPIMARCGISAPLGLPVVPLV